MPARHAGNQVSVGSRKWHFLQFLSHRLSLYNFNSFLFKIAAGSYLPSMGGEIAAVAKEYFLRYCFYFEWFPTVGILIAERSTLQLCWPCNNFSDTGNAMDKKEFAIIKFTGKIRFCTDMCSTASFGNLPTFFYFPCQKSKQWRPVSPYSENCGAAFTAFYRKHFPQQHLGTRVKSGRKLLDRMWGSLPGRTVNDLGRVFFEGKKRIWTLPKRRGEVFREGIAKGLVDWDLVFGLAYAYHPTEINIKYQYESKGKL